MGRLELEGKSCRWRHCFSGFEVCALAMQTNIACRRKDRAYACSGPEDLIICQEPWHGAQDPLSLAQHLLGAEIEPAACSDVQAAMYTQWLYQSSGRGQWGPCIDRAQSGRHFSRMAVLNRTLTLFPARFICKRCPLHISMPTRLSASTAHVGAGWPSRYFAKNSLQNAGYTSLLMAVLIRPISESKWCTLCIVSLFKG